MPTRILRTAKHSTKTGDEPLHKTDEKVEMINVAQNSGQSQSLGQGQRLGGHSRERRHTPPEQDKDSDSARARLKAFDKTPSNRAKVLPWVEGVITQDYQPPEGMFGPYDSQPPTRRQTVAEPSVPSPPRHPFAYTAGRSLPFSALAGDPSTVENDNPVTQPRRPESDLLNRGAGLKALAEHISLPASNGSPGMGTFGREASQEAAPASRNIPPKTPPKSPRKPARSSPRKPVPTGPPDTSHSNGILPNMEPVEPPHIHHPHSEYPFSLEEAGRKRAEAVAHLEALQRLESGNGQVSPGGGVKGPRETYQTMTSGPSFGHIWHANGMPLPISRGASMQPEHFMSAPQHLLGGGTLSRGFANIGGGGAFYHIPFGSNRGVPLPSAFVFGNGNEDSGLSPYDVGRVAESPESAKGGQRRDDRSAYVETVHDEQEPTVRASRSRATSKADKTTLHTPTAKDTAAKSEFARPRSNSTAPREPVMATSGRPKTEFSKSQPIPAAHRSPLPTGTAPYPQGPSIAPSAHPTLGGQMHHQPSNQLDNPQGHTYNDRYGPFDHQGLGPLLGPYMVELARLAAVQGTTTDSRDHGAPIDPSHHSTGLPFAQMQKTPELDPSTPTMPSQSRSVQQDTKEELRFPYAPSVVSTTPSNIKQAVAKSKFHDEILCQLLDAARLNLIGDEAKKALNRAATARVIELRDLRAKGELTEQDMLASRQGGKKKERRARSRERQARRHSRHRSECSERDVRRDSTGDNTPPKIAQTKAHSRAQTEYGVPEMPPLPPMQPKDAHPITPPEWAIDIIDRLAAFDERFSELERQHREGHQFDEPSQDIPGDLIDELMFSTQNFPQGLVNPEGIHAMTVPFGISPFDFPFPRLSFGESTSRGGAQIRAVTPSIKRDTTGTMEWGSDVELPQPGEKISPPKTPRTAAGPIINIQAPTESNVDKSQRAHTPSIAGARDVGPSRTEVEVIEEQVIDLPETALPDPRERDLPPRPSESNRSYRPSPVSGATPYRNADSPSAKNTGEKPTSMKSVFDASSIQPKPPNVPITVGLAQTPIIQSQRNNPPNEVPESQTAYKTAFQSLPETPPRTVRDIVHVIDPIHTTMTDPTPWDLITQRLYSWGLVWDEHAFSRAMQEISLGKQVEEFALSIYVMVILKRMVRRSMSETPFRVCDKLFVPPTMADAINKAVHANNHKAAQQMLEEMWYPFLFKEPPRVIIALSRHLAEDDVWTAHRWDLGTGRLRSYKVCHESRGHDGRPFMWWHAIRNAWPQYHIKDPSELAQQTTTITTNAMDRNNNSLIALNCARNLFLGFRPEHPTDLAKLRESVWGEVKRLLNKKKMGRLIVDMDSPSHATSF